MDTQDRVMYVDFTGEGFRYDDWPIGYFLAHGAPGTIIAWERGCGEVPDRPIVSFNINWFYRMWERQGIRVPPHVYEGDGFNPKLIIGRRSRHHIVNLSNRKEVRQVEEARAVVENILNRMAWPDVIKYMPDGDERAFLLRTEHEKQTDKLPGEMPLIIRKIASYNYLRHKYGKDGNDALSGKYERLMNVQLLEMERVAQENDITIKRSAPERTRKEEKGMAKAAKAAAPAPTAKKKGKGIDKEDIRTALATVKAEEPALIKLAKDKFGVTIAKGTLADAPNAGVMKMRAGNAIRNALKKAGTYVE